MGFLFYMKNRFRRYIFPERELMSALKNIMGNQPMSILDVGCGSGWFLAEVLEIAPSKSQGLGIEVDSRYFSSVNLPDEKRMTIQGDENIPDGQFNLIMYNDVLHHIYNKQDFLTYYLDKLHKDGYVLIKDMCKDNPLYTFWNRLHDKILSCDNIKETSMEEIQQILGSGFECVCNARKRILLYDHFWCIFKKIMN